MEFLSAQNWHDLCYYSETVKRDSLLNLAAYGAILIGSAGLMRLILAAWNA